MTVCTDVEILNGYGVAQDADATSSPDEHGIDAPGNDNDASDVSVLYDDDNDNEAGQGPHQKVIGGSSDDVVVPDTNGFAPVRRSRKGNTGRAVTSTDDGT